MLWSLKDLINVKWCFPCGRLQYCFKYFAAFYIKIYIHLPIAIWLAMFLSLASGLAIWLALTCGMWVEVTYAMTEQSHCALFPLPQDWHVSHKGISFTLDAALRSPGEQSLGHHSHHRARERQASEILALWPGHSLVKVTHSPVKEVLHPGKESTQSAWRALWWSPWPMCSDC